MAWSVSVQLLWSKPRLTKQQPVYWVPRIAGQMYHSSVGIGLLSSKYWSWKFSFYKVWLWNNHTHIELGKNDWLHQVRQRFLCSISLISTVERKIISQVSEYPIKQSITALSLVLENWRISKASLYSITPKIIQRPCLLFLQNQSIKHLNLTFKTSASTKCSGIALCYTGL